MPTMPELHFQDLANTAWSFARLGVTDQPLMHSIAAAAIARISDFDPLGLSNLLWAYAKLELQDQPLLAAISSAARAKLSDYSSQNLANTAWSVAKLGVSDPPLMEAIASAAIRKLKEFTAFDLSILVWAFDILNLGDLLERILPDAVDYFTKDLEDDDEFGMFWFDFANVVSTRIEEERRGDFDATFEDKLLGPVAKCLAELSATDTAHNTALKTWQERVDLWQIPYLGPVYSGVVLARLGVH